jgi:hypothetical protein
MVGHSPPSGSPQFLTCSYNFAGEVAACHAQFVLVHWDAVQLPQAPLYNGPFCVLKWSTHYFLLQLGDHTFKGGPVEQVPPAVQVPPRRLPTTM